MLTIAETCEATGLPESTLRYWERIGLLRPVERDDSSNHRRYAPDQLDTLRTLANLRKVGLPVREMRRYLAQSEPAEQRDLFAEQARRVGDEIAQLELQRRYLELKVAYWDALAGGDVDKSERIAAELRPLIVRLHA